MTVSDSNTELSVRLEQEGEVAHIVLNRPQALNALNVDMLASLVAAIKDSQDAAALVIYGEGRAFCVGEDLRETLAPETGQAEELRGSFEKLQDLTRLLTALRAPVVIAAHGYAVGGGAELALAGDFIIAGPDLQVRFPEVPIGHAVTGGITARLTATIGLIRAKSMLLTGRWITAEESLSTGMVTEIAEDPIARAKELGRTLGEMPRNSMGATKVGIELASIPHQELVMSSEVDAASVCFAADDAAGAYLPFQRDGAESDG